MNWYWYTATHVAHRADCPHMADQPGWTERSDIEPLPRSTVNYLGKVGRVCKACGNKEARAA